MQLQCTVDAAYLGLKDKIFMTKEPFFIYFAINIPFHEIP